jgi:pyruvate/2-oxoglutarate dehydrogenase complex dihydrolipoamide dehydrogenase (E3) component
MKGVYAIEICATLVKLLAHVASFQGEMVAELIAGTQGEPTTLLPFPGHCIHRT